MTDGFCAWRERQEDILERQANERIERIASEKAINPSAVKVIEDFYFKIEKERYNYSLTTRQHEVLKDELEKLKSLIT